MSDTIGRYNIILELVSQNQKLTEGVNQVKKEMGSLNGVFKAARRAFVAIFAVSAIKNAITAIGQTTAKYQQYNTILTNTLQSQEKANEAFSLIKDIAEDSVFSVDELTSSYIKFINRGVNPTREQIISLTDLAASQGKSFDQLTEAVLDAQTGEFERLKEFGIRASKEGDKVSLSFKGQTVAVQNTADAINEALVGFGQLPGVLGSNAVQMDTITGRISRLNDTLDSAVVQIGDFLLPVFNFFLDAASRGLTIVGNLVTRFVSFARESKLLDTIFTQVSRTFAFWKNVITTLTPIVKGFFESFAGKVVVQTIKNVAEVLRALPAIANGVLESFKAAFKGIENFAARTVVRSRILIEEAKQLVGLGNQALLDGLRDQLDNFRSEGLVDAFKRGFNEIQDIEIEIPDASGPAFASGEMAGESFGDGVTSGVKKSKGKVEKEVIDLFGALEGEISRLQGVLQNQSAVGDIFGATQTAERIRELLRQLNGVNDVLTALSTGSQIKPLSEITGVENFASQTDQAFKTFEDVTNSIDERLKISDPNVTKGGFIQRLLGLDDDGLKLLKETLDNALTQTREFVDNILEENVRRSEQEVSVQEERVRQATTLAEKGNAELLQSEEERLDELQNKRERALQRQRQLAAVEIAINQALAISDTIRNIASNPALAPFLIASIIAGIASAGVAINSAFSDLPTFNLGTEMVGADKRFKRVSSDREGFVARFNGYERIVPENINKKLSGFPNSKLPDAVAAYKAFGRNPFTGFNNTTKGVDLGAKMDRVADAVENMKVRVKLDRKGFEVNQQAYRNRALRRRKITA